MAWTDLSFPFGSVLSSSQMTNLDANFDALAAGDTGAPTIQTSAYATGSIIAAGIAANAITAAKIAAGAVGTSEIEGGAITAAKIVAGAVGPSEIAADAVGISEVRESFVEVSTNLVAGESLILSSGSYAFYPRIRLNTGAVSSFHAKILDGAITTSNVTYIWLQSIHVDYTITANQTYISASPPYDLGDGDVPLFVFAKIDKVSGKVVSSYSAQEASWHYNGPTNICGKQSKDGKKYRKRRDLSNCPCTFEEAKHDMKKMAEYQKHFVSAPIIKEEITQAIKNADMHLIPRPMEPDKDTVVVMLDPVCDLMHEIACMRKEHDEFSFNELLHEGHIKIDNTPLKRFGPPGVDIVGFDYR